DYGGKNECTDCGSIGYVGWHCGKRSPTGLGGRGKVGALYETQTTYIHWGI
ncbi:hypothetical protein A2U01_0083292, partial [Trifolium medium]|nr:hypothetical protein [Trifolium medium]